MVFNNKTFNKMIDFQKYAEEITPEYAALLLEKNYKNRSVTDASVIRYAREMENGQFKQNGQPIIIGDQDALLDGQHRLLAIIKSGVSIRALIVYNVPQDSFDTIDNHKKRTTGDSFTVVGYANARTLAAIVQRIFLVENNITSKGNTQTNVSDSQKRAFVEANPHIHDIVRKAKNYYTNFKILSESDWGIMIYQFNKLSPYEADDFLEKLSTGRNISSPRDSSILLLRNRLIDVATSKLTLPLREKMALIYKAWNYYRRGFNAKTLRWHSDQPYPFPE